MRILMLVPQAFYSPRGTPLSAYHRAKDLLALGHDVEILTYPVGDPPPDRGLVVHRAGGPHFARRIRQGPSYLKIWFDILMLPNLVYRLARRRYDALYAHEEGAVLAALVAPLFGIPVVYDMHSSLPRQIREWEFSDAEWVVRVFGWLERFAVRRAAAVVAISPGLAAVARRYAPPGRVVTIVNRFELEAEPTPEVVARLRAELGLAAGQPMVLYSGSFVALQALDLLVRAIPTVAASVPKVRFVLVGGRPAEILELGALAREVGASEHLLMLPARPQQEMPAFMAAASVLVSPRVKGINPPGKLFSYLNSGRPIVATATEVHTQFLTSECAILTAPDPGALAQGILRALLDSGHSSAITQAAKRKLLEDYSPEVKTAAYRRLIALLTSAAGGTASPATAETQAVPEAPERAH